GRIASRHLDLPGTRKGGGHQVMQLRERLVIVVTSDSLRRIGRKRGQLGTELTNIAGTALRRILDVVDLGRWVVLEHVEQGELGLMLRRLLHSIHQGTVCGRGKIRWDKNMRIDHLCVPFLLRLRCCQGDVSAASAVYR